jgi:hypothetical protein
MVSVLLPDESPNPPPVSRVERGHPRRIAFALAGLALLLLVAIVKPWAPPAAGGQPAVAMGAPTAQASPGGGTPPVPSWRVRPRPTSPIEGTAWQLDFSRSGLSADVCNQSCNVHGTLASALQFRDGQVAGDTGLGGGCDVFSGRYDAVNAASLRIAVPSYPSRCWGTGTDLEIRLRLDRASDYAVKSSSLSLLDHDGNVLLVYARSSGG